NLSSGNVTSTVVTPFAVGDGITTCPDSARPLTVPSTLNVSGPQRPDPSPSTRNVDEADSTTAVSASGKLFSSLGVEADSQSVGSVSYHATSVPGLGHQAGERKSVRVGVVVFFANDGPIE